jgi:four helix bundle protein
LDRIKQEVILARGDDIEDRLVDFSVAVINLCTHLPKNRAALHVQGQLLESGTSPAPNYAEARGAESKRDFVHKLGIALKELNESQIWLRVIKKCRWLPEQEVDVVFNECVELSKIVNSSIRTAKNN